MSIAVFFFFKRIWIYLAHYALYYGDLDACLNQAGTGHQYNVRLMLDRCCILVENENRIDVSIWRQFVVDLMLDFGYTT